jgi:hypothetical protein
MKKILLIQFIIISETSLYSRVESVNHSAKQQAISPIQQNSDTTDSTPSDNQQTTSNNNNNVAKTIVKGAAIAGGIAATAYAGKKIKKAYDKSKQKSRFEEIFSK